MPKLQIIYDPLDRIYYDPAVIEAGNLKLAVLSIPKDLEGKDIYALARRLAELLLEQL